MSVHFYVAKCNNQSGLDRLQCGDKKSICFLIFKSPFFMSLIGLAYTTPQWDSAYYYPNV